jgi:hypothetical protein
VAQKGTTVIILENILFDKSWLFLYSEKSFIQYVLSLTFLSFQNFFFFLICLCHCVSGIKTSYLMHQLHNFFIVYIWGWFLNLCVAESEDTVDEQSEGSEDLSEQYPF